LTSRGGRRIVLAAVQNPVSLERILRHVNLWPAPADIESIRGPPDDLWPADLDAGADVDAQAEDVLDDWAA
jgi:hypothetical protein